MAILAEGLPFLQIPEQLPVSPVRDNVIHHCSRRQFALWFSLKRKSPARPVEPVDTISIRGLCPLITPDRCIACLMVE